MCIKHTGTCKIGCKLLCKVLNASRHLTNWLCVVEFLSTWNEDTSINTMLTAAGLFSYKILLSDPSVFLFHSTILIYTHTAVCSPDLSTQIYLLWNAPVLPVLAASVATINTVFIAVCQIGPTYTSLVVHNARMGVSLLRIYYLTKCACEKICCHNFTTLPEQYLQELGTNILWNKNIFCA